MHRKDGVPKKLCGSVKGGLDTGKIVCLGTYCSPVRWPRRNHVVQ